MNKTRLEAFSDGVIAIIITIMVLEMRAPEGTSWEEIKPLVPKFICYGLSFLFVAIYWGNHHHLVHTVKRVTPGIMWSNMNLLFWLSLIPFERHGWEKIILKELQLRLMRCWLCFVVHLIQFLKNRLLNIMMNRLSLNRL